MLWPEDELTCTGCGTIYTRLHYERNPYVKVYEGAPCPEQWMMGCKGTVVRVSSAASGRPRSRGGVASATSDKSGSYAESLGLHPWEC